MSPSSIESLEQRTYFAISLSVTHFNVGDNPNGVLYAPVIGDFDRDGIKDLVLPDASSDGATSGVFTFAKGNGRGQFTIGTRTQGGIFTYGAQAGDFNGDHKLDIIAPNPGVQGQAAGTNLQLLLGNGDGTFQAPVSITVGNNPLGLVVADFNGDGISDVAVGNRASSSVSILLGGSGGLTLGSTLDAGTGSDPASVVAGDFNGDAKTDIVVGNAASGGPGLETFLGNGNGTFATTPITTSGPPGVTGVGDFNGDGKLDVAVSVSDQGVPTILLGNGDGSFVASGTFPTGGNIALVGDYDGDGKLDIAYTTSTSPSSLNILGGRGDGSFIAPLVIPKTDDPGVGTVGDINGDTRPDLLVAGQTRGNARVVDALINTSTPGSGPDLTGTIVAKGFPSAVVGGAKGTASVLVSNTGSIVASGKVSVTLSVTGNGQPDTVLGTVTAKLKLKPSVATKGKVLKFKFTYPGTLPDGSYTLVANIDTTNVVSEQLETNNTATSSPLTIAAPFVDLTGAYSGVVPSALTGGQKATISVLVTNNGNVTAAGPMTINLIAQAPDANSSDASLGTVTSKIKLAAGKSKVFKIKAIVPTGITGARAMVAQVNATNSVLPAELDLSNNAVSTTVTFS